MKNQKNIDGVPIFESTEKGPMGLPEQKTDNSQKFQIDNKNLEMITKIMELKSKPDFVEFVQKQLGKGQKFGSLTNEQLAQFAKGYEKMALYKKDPGFMEYVKGRDVDKLESWEVAIYAQGYEARKIHEAKLKNKNTVGGQGTAGGFDSVVVGSGEGNGTEKKSDKPTDQVVVGGDKKNTTSHEVEHKIESKNDKKETQKQEKTDTKTGYAKTSAQRVESLKKIVSLTDEEAKALAGWDSKKVNDLQYEMDYFVKSEKHKNATAEEKEAYKQHLLKKYSTETANTGQQEKKEEKPQEKTETKTETKPEQTTKPETKPEGTQVVEGNVLEKVVQNPDGSKTKQIFSKEGKLISEATINKDGSKSLKKYDESGKVIQENKVDTQGNKSMWEIKKDANGQEIRIEIAQSADGKNSKMVEVRADGSKTETTVNENGKEMIVYDKDGKVIDRKVEKNPDNANKPNSTDVVNVNGVENKPEISQMEKIINWSQDLEKSGMPADKIQELLNSDEAKKFLQSKEGQVDWGNKDNLEKYAEWRQDILKDLPENLNKIQKFQTLNKLDSIVGGKEADKIEQMYNDYFLKENVEDPTKPGVWDTIKKNALGTVLPYINRYTNKIPGMDEVRDWTGFNLRHFVQSEPDTWADFSWKEKLFLLGKANQYGSVLEDFKSKGLPVEYMEEWLSDEKNNAEVLKLIKEPKKQSSDLSK